MKLNPFIGLNNLNKEEYKNLTPFHVFERLEEMCPSYQEGQAKDLFLFFFFINILVKANIDFLVKGGILLNMFLGEHARPCMDIDVYVKDPFLFFDETNIALNNEKGDFRFETKWLKSSEANKNYYQNTFAFVVSAYREDTLIKEFVVDGTYSNHYDKLKRIKYDGPKVIDENFHFYGVSFSHMAVIKTLAATSEQARPVKHLIDLYSLIQFPLDIKEYKTELFELLDNENKIRKSLGIPVLFGEIFIKKDKEFLDSFVLTELYAGYSLSEEDMISYVNNWLDLNVNK